MAPTKPTTRVTPPVMSSPEALMATKTTSVDGVNAATRTTRMSSGGLTNGVATTIALGTETTSGIREVPGETPDDRCILHGTEGCEEVPWVNAGRTGWEAIVVGISLQSGGCHLRACGRHTSRPRGAGYPPDFDPNMYMSENGGMMPPPHMMMPHLMGGRGQYFPPGGRGGRGGRGSFYAGRGGKDGENGETPTAKTTLHVRHVDPKYVNMTMLSLHFSKFGNVVNVQMRPSAKCAFVQYATEEEAKKAFHSPLPVCNNRFISVKWARHDAQSPEEAADQPENASNEATGEDGAPTGGETAEKNAEAEGESAESLPENNMTAEELRAAALEKGRKVLEQKRELLEKQRALKKQKEALIKRQLAQQKELLERMSANSAQFSIAEKRDLLNKITALSAELKALTPRNSAVSPSAASRSETGEGGENLNGLKAELSALEAEAGGRGGRGGRWSAGRGGYRGGRGGRGRGGFGRGSHTLDNRTTIVKVANLPEEACDPVVLTQHFGNFGAVERVVMDETAPGQGFIKFQDRYAGQAALNHGNVFGDKQLQMAWIETQEAPTELQSPTTGDSAAPEAGDGAVSNEQVRRASWRGQLMKTD
ncbi:RNA recognition motif-containing protein [Phytophthora infestans]|uniref:RNA recognition motif-containing protein n=1 Tax=Phytophthora infestans TaxID=4787 RepID=A0A833SY63_PHYIN|nr:RNA recognition motif-containing protein [Phytophthora infestans]